VADRPDPSLAPSAPSASSDGFDRTPVVVAGARTPMGRLQGSLKDFSGADLGGVAIRGALDKAGVDPQQVEYVIMGQVLTAGAGQIPARQAAVAAGIPMTVPALTINKVCLSGLDAIALAAQLVRLGEFDVVVAGGQESMSQAPHLLLGSRNGYKYGDVPLRDHMQYDGLWDAFTDVAMGELTEAANQADQYFGREEQDAFAARSHQLAAQGWKNGLYDDEVVPVAIPQRKGDPILFKEDEGIRPDTTVESLARLKPAFRKDGTITAGSASQISDGAAAVVVMSRGRASPGSRRSAHTGSSPVRTPRSSTSPPPRSRPRSPRRASRSPSWTSSRSTKPSRRSAWRRSASSVSTRRWSTSTAGPSPSATPSACQARGSSCTSRWNWPGAVAGSASPASVAAAVRATRSSSGCRPADGVRNRAPTGREPAH
jgi:acetyl-CoA acetyltransferase family protein